MPPGRIQWRITEAGYAALHGEKAIQYELTEKALDALKEPKKEEPRDDAKLAS